MLDPVELFPEVPNIYAFPCVHADMVFDKSRVAAYRDAINETVKPGDVVADLGSGTGLLSFLCLQAGAARVHAIESGKNMIGRALVAFGGAAPLHAARIAEKLDIDRVVVPVNAGVGFAFLGDQTNSFTGGDNNAEARFNDTSKVLEFDTDGDGTADLEVTLLGVDLANLGLADFTVG